MTSKLKCPVCPFCGGEFDIISIKRKMLGCPKCLHIADGAFWKKAIQAKQDLEILKAALNDAKQTLLYCWGDYDIRAAKCTAEHVDKVLKQIEHKE